MKCNNNDCWGVEIHHHTLVHTYQRLTHQHHEFLEIIRHIYFENENLVENLNIYIFSSLMVQRHLHHCLFCLLFLIVVLIVVCRKKKREGREKREERREKREKKREKRKKRNRERKRRREKKKKRENKEYPMSIQMKRRRKKGFHIYM
jgi:flagellar biosynthesis/type III secretory pathway M-ring protein FliF/YscJ